MNTMTEKAEAAQRRGEVLAALNAAKAAKNKAGDNFLYSVLNHGTKPDKRDREWERTRRTEFIAAEALYKVAFERLWEHVRGDYEATPEGKARSARRESEAA